MTAINAASTSNLAPLPHLTFGPSRLMSVPPPVLRPLLTSAWSARISRCEPSARRHDSTTDTQADLPGYERPLSPCARRVYVTTLLMVTGFTFLSRLTQIAPPCTRFVFLGAGIRLGLPSHPASRRRSCLRLGVITTSSSRGLSPPSDRPCRAYSRAAPLRGTASGAPRAGLWPWGGPARRARAVPSRPASVDLAGSLVTRSGQLRSLSLQGSARHQRRNGHLIR
jgi:hypothetical protein